MVTTGFHYLLSAATLCCTYHFSSKVTLIVKIFFYLMILQPFRTTTVSPHAQRFLTKSL